VAWLKVVEALPQLGSAGDRIPHLFEPFGQTLAADIGSGR